MSSNLTRKQAIKEYKERKTPRGIYAMRCTNTGQVWVGSSLNLDATRNRLWFSLKHGTQSGGTLQQEWDTHGEQAFQYEVLEKLDDDVLPIAIYDLLKEKKHTWAVRVGGQVL